MSRQGRAGTASLCSYIPSPLDLYLYYAWKLCLNLLDVEDSCGKGQSIVSHSDSHVGTRKTLSWANGSMKKIEKTPRM